MSSSPDTFPDKHPLTDRAVSINWAQDLDTANSEHIASSTWAYTGDDSSLVLSLPSHNDTLASVFVSGGTLGAQYKLTNTIVTNSTPAETLVSAKYLNIREIAG